MVRYVIIGYNEMNILLLALESKEQLLKLAWEAAMSMNVSDFQYLSLEHALEASPLIHHLVFPPTVIG